MKNKRNIFLFIIIFAVAGIALLIITKAASPSFSLDPSTATVSSPASIVSDSTTGNASGKAIAFGAAVTPPPPPPPSGCTGTGLIFCDDFSGAAGAGVDTSKWSILSGASGWGVECWSSSPNHLATDGAGNLKLTVSQESGCGRSYTSAGINTNSFYAQAGDRIDIRAKAACGGGVWPALWTSTGNNGPSWPNSGEIDILEIMDGDQFNAQQTVHGGPSSSSWQINLGAKSSTRWCEAFHTYSVEWQPSSITFYIDNNVTHVDTPSQVPSGQTWPFDKSYNNKPVTNRILMDLQIGNTGGTINNADLPSSMLIDYIKVFNVGVKS